MNELKHDDGCRCQGCCREKFKTIDPARVGQAPATDGENPFLHGVPRPRIAPPKE